MLLWTWPSLPANQDELRDINLEIQEVDPPAHGQSAGKVPILNEI